MSATGLATGLETFHAPAVRATPESLARQAALFSELMFRELLQHVPDMVLVLNSHRQVVFANDAVLQYSRAAEMREVIGNRPGEVFRCKHSAETPGGCGTTLFCRYCGAVNAVLQSQSGTPATEECRITVVRAGSEEGLELRVWARPLQIGSEQFTFFAMLNIAEEKRRQFLERIFLHDILNTATALRGFSKLLTAGMVKEALREQYILRLHGLSDRIVEEIESHQQLVAAENGELKPEFQSISSATILQGLYASYDRDDLLNGRKLALDAEAATVQFESDPVLLQRVIGNMIKNAIEASAPGETVIVGCCQAPGKVAFWVQNPTYMPENIRLQVFNRSFSTKGRGRGLGTYSMKFLTERYLGGSIAFTSSEKDGTRFTACYPLQQAARTGSGRSH